MGNVFTSYRPIRTQTIAVGAASVAVANSFGDSIMVVRLASTTAAHFAIGVAPVATAADALLPANTVEFVAVRPGEKIAMIQNSAAGTARVTEVSQ